MSGGQPLAPEGTPGADGDELKPDSSPTILDTNGEQANAGETTLRKTAADDEMSESDPRQMKKKKIKTTVFAFANSERIREKVRQDKKDGEKPAYDVTDLYKDQGCFQSIARHSTFENLTLGIIMVNALWISFDTDLNKADVINDAHPVFIVADSLFFGYFAVELFIRFMSFRSKCTGFTDPWFAFDTILVTLYMFDPFTIGIITAASGGDGLNLPLSVLRLCRLARLSRLVRMLRSLPELMIMIKGMVKATASVGYTMGLLLTSTYIFAIALRNLVPKCEMQPCSIWHEDDDGNVEECCIEELYFSSVPEAMHNLITFGTFLDELAAFMLPIKQQSPVCLVACWLYVMIAAMTKMNMLIGVLCEVITMVAEEEKESMIVDKVHTRFKDIVAELDTDQDGTLSWDEFSKICDNKQAYQLLERVNVDPEILVELAEDFFQENGEYINVEFPDFMDLILDLRGGQEATVKHIFAIGKRINSKFYDISTRMDKVGKALNEVSGTIMSLA